MPWPRTRYLNWLAGLAVGVTFESHFLAAQAPHAGHGAEAPSSNTPSAAGPAAELPETPAPQAAGTLTLADIEQMALQRNPTLVQAAAQIQMSRGKALQAGLYPNPTIGYVAEQIGSRDTPAGEFQGGFIQQEIVTAGKLRLSRAKYQQEAFQAEIQAQAQQLRVINNIQIAFYEVLASQRQTALDRKLAELNENAVKATEELANVGQGNVPDLLQAQVEANRARVALRTAERRRRREWQHLVTLIGAPELAQVPLAGSLEPDGPPLQREAELCRLLSDSPEIQAARAEVVRDEIALQRERVEPVPNIVVRGEPGYNFETRSTTVGVQVSLRVPVFNRNQGTIHQAEGELVRAKAEVNRVELSLRRRFADTFARYETAWDSVRDFREQSLPKSRRAYELYQEFFQKRRAAWPQVLVAERTYTQLQEEYVNALLDLRRAEVEIRGFLLMDGLSQPPAPTPQGHREATPTPR